MHNANHIMKCKDCGAEFKSRFAGATSAFGCIEDCPHCLKPFSTPVLIGGINYDYLQRALNDPINRNFGAGGQDGYVYMGKGELLGVLHSELIIPVYAAYDRNIRRALDLLDLHEGVATAQAQVLLSAVYILTMTACEGLIVGLLSALESKGLVPPTPKPKKGNITLKVRREHLFASLGISIDTLPLDHLYWFRNCLAHNAGIVDEKSMNGLKSLGAIPQELQSLSVGSPLVLTALIATTLADFLQHTARELFIAAQKKCDAAGL